MNLIIIFSILICVGSVTAQDSSNMNLTIDDSSPTDFSQINIVDETYETESVEGISESSANEQNSSENLHTTVSQSKSSDKLGASNDNEILGYNHTYDYAPTVTTLKNLLDTFPSVTKGAHFAHANVQINVYFVPEYPLEGESLTIYVENTVHKLDTMDLTESPWGAVNLVGSTELTNGKHDYFYYTMSSTPAGKHNLHFHNTGGTNLGAEMDLIIYEKTSTELFLSNSSISKGEKVNLSVKVIDVIDNVEIKRGTVSYYLEDGTPIAEHKSVTDVITYEPDDVGKYKIYAKYEGYIDHENNYFHSESTSQPKDLEVKATSSVTVSDDSIIVGQTASITVDLVNSTDIDTITISDGTNTYSFTDLTTVINHEKYTFKVPNLKPGTYTVRVTNSVNEGYKTSSGEGTITVSKATSSIDVVDQTITYGETVDITATIVNSTGVSSATLYKDGQPYTTVTPTISGDKITIINLPRGEYTLNATTAGDDNHNSSWDTCRIIVNPAGSEVIVPSQTIVFDASAVLDITGQNTTGISKVEIFDKDGNKVDVTPTVDGQKVTVSGLNVGEYTIRVTNDVDDNHVQDTSEGKITVLPAGSEVTVENKTVVYGSPVTVSVGGENTIGISKIEVFKDGEVVSVVYTNTSSEITFTDLDVGNYTVQVTNTVDGNHIQNTGVGTINVTKAGSEMAVENKTVVYGSPVTVSVGGENTTGISKIEVLKDGEVVSVVYTNTSSEITFTDLDVGNYTVKVTNTVDGNHESTVGVGTINVTKAKSSVDMNDIVINHGEDVNDSATTKNATGITFVVLKDDTQITNGEGEGSGDSYDVIIKDLEPGEYTLKVTTKVDDNHESVTEDFKITVKPVVNLTITKEVVGETTVLVGDKITYTITVTNKGPSTATEVKVVDTLSGPAEVVVGESSAGYADGGWIIDSIAADDHVELNLVVLTNNRGNVSNSVSVTSKENDTEVTATADNVTAVSVILNVNKTSVPYIAFSHASHENCPQINTINYTIMVSNVGLDDATDVEIVDELPSYLSLRHAGYISKPGVIVSVDEDKTNNVVTWNIEKMDNETVVLLWVQAELHYVVPVGTNITNEVTATSKENKTVVSNKTNVTVVPGNLTITKTANVTYVGNNSVVNYTIVVKNKSLVNLSWVSIFDTLPSGLTYINASSFEIDGVKYSPVYIKGTESNGLFWADSHGDYIKSLDNSTEIVLWVTARTNSIGDITNQARAGCGENKTYQDAFYTIHVVPVNLTVSKTADVSNISYSAYDDEKVNKINYTIVVDNPSLADAHDVIVVDSLHEGLTLVDAGFVPVSGVNVVVTKSGNNVKWNISKVANQTQVQLWIQAEISKDTPLGNISNEVTITCRENSTGTSNKTNVTVLPTNLTIVKEVVGKTTVSVGEEITYTITVTNDGVGIVSNVTVTDVLSGPAKIVVDKCTVPEGSTFDGTVWTIEKIDAGDQIALTVVAVPYLDGTVKNNVSVVCEENKTPETNESVPVSVTPVVDLEITKKVDMTKVQVGDVITFTITVTNHGPSNATGVKVSEKLSDLVNLTKPVDGYDGKVWTVGDLDANQTKELILVVKVIGNGTIPNNVNVSANENDTNKSNDNDSSENVTAEPVVDLEITKVVDKTTVNVGETITYTITVKNNGPSKATGVEVTEKLSDLVELVESVDGYADGVWSVGDLYVNETVELVLVVKVINNGTVENFVSVKGNENDTNESNNNDTSDNVTAVPVVDLEINKSVDKTTVNVGETITYTITVKNNGPSKATGVEVTEELSDLVELVESVDGYTDGVWSVGDLDVNETVELVLVVKIINNGTVENFVSVKGNENDTNMSNNNDTSDNVTAVPVVDLEISKVVDKTTVNVGEEITYTITVTNNGPSKATGVEVTEELSGLVELVESVDGYDGKVWTVGDLDVNQTKELVLVVKIINNGTVENFVSVKANENDTNESNNNDTSDNVTAKPVSDLSINKTVNTTETKVGQNIVYTIVVKNNGPSTATGVYVTEKLSELVVFVSATGDGSYDDETGIWNVGTLANGSTAQIALTVKVINNGTIENGVNVSGNEEDTNETNNNYTSDNVTANPVVNLVANVTVNDTTPIFGQEIEFVIEITNEGPSDATQVIVHNAISEGLKDVVVTPSVGTYDEQTGSWKIYKIKVGEKPTLTIKGTVDTLKAFNDIVEITHLEEREDQTDDDVAESPEVDPVPIVDVELTIVVDRPVVDYGDVMEFIITVKNNGPNDASDVSVDNVIPEGFVYVSDNLTDADYQATKDKLMAPGSAPSFDASTGAWYIGDLANGTETKLALMLQANYIGTKAVDSTVSAAERETDYTNNNGSADVTVKAIADIQLEKTVDKTKINTGDKVTYTFTVTNNGPNDATGVKMTDSAITQFRFVSASSDDYDSETGVWTIGDLANGTSVTLTVTVIIDKAGTYPNSASVSANENDINMSNNNNSSDDVDVDDIEEPEVDSDVPQNETSEVAEKEVKEQAELPATGNPVLIALLALVTAILLPLRRRD